MGYHHAKKCVLNQETLTLQSRDAHTPINSHVDCKLIASHTLIFSSFVSHILLQKNKSFGDTTVGRLFV